MQTPYEQAAALYPDNEDFQADLLPHLVSGYVISSPTLFAMFRPVDSTAAPEILANPWCTFAKPDAWFIWMVAGDVNEIYKRMPYPLPLLGASRFGQPVRFYPLKRAQEIACILCG
jgi:hypothetical protein